MNKDRLLQIVIDQQEELKHEINREEMIPREQDAWLHQVMDKTPVKIIMGIRRSGKSTLLLQAIKEKRFIYFNFDEENLSQISSSDLSLLLELGQKIILNPQYYVFDEIQNIQGWELFINKLHRKKMNVLLTGSNSRLLSSELATHLTGRQISIELFPFSFSEYLKSMKVNFLKTELMSSDSKILAKNHFLNYMSRGGFPEILNEELDSKYSKMYLKELYDKIISRDLAQRRKIKNIKALKEISLHMLSLYSSQFTFQSIRKTSSIKSVNTVKNYVEYLQEAYLGFILEPFSFKIKERISLPKKYYVIDTSLIDVIAGKTVDDRGKKLENIVFIELKRRGLEIYYYKQSSYEVDFILREGKIIVELIQVCWTIEDIKTKTREIKALVMASAELKCKNLTLITFDEEEQITQDSLKINCVPIWKWLLNRNHMQKIT
ncbi:MAG TPA: ATP-binding protein [Pseudobdellovibrionaceae bacterium]|nr:ATP-binding protein [Pseudobdellovibrionaceae bacterium]